jgi:hypothetical protein
MRYQLNTQALAHFVRTKRAGRPLREVAQEIGDISPATLSRVENEKAPDLLVFCTSVIGWPWLLGSF